MTQARTRTDPLVCDSELAYDPSFLVRLRADSLCAAGRIHVLSQVWHGCHDPLENLAQGYCNVQSGSVESRAKVPEAVTHPRCPQRKRPKKRQAKSLVTSDRLGLES